jgi:hypothetical protein
MDQALDEWFKEYGRLCDGLEPYRSSIVPKVYGAGASQPLSEPESVFFNLYYYWGGALCNSGDVFGYVSYIIDHEADFVAIGAHGTIKALAGLMPHFREQEQLTDQTEKDEYWRRTRDERAAVEGIAEGVHEFARLLLAYAEKNLAKATDG